MDTAAVAMTKAKYPGKSVLAASTTDRAILRPMCSAALVGGILVLVVLLPGALPAAAAVMPRRLAW
jgi:hypothetical protein